MAHSKLIIHNSDKSFQLDMFYITTSTILVPIEILQTYHYREFQMFQMSLNPPSDERLLFCFAFLLIYVTNRLIDELLPTLQYI